MRLALFNRTYDALGKGQLSDGKSREMGGRQGLARFAQGLPAVDPD
jgi:hypothetical protein